MKTIIVEKDADGFVKTTADEIKKLVGDGMWRKFHDGWFTYYYNIETGQKKFKLDPEDIEIT